MNLVLPRPPDIYDAREQARARTELEQEDARSLKVDDIAERTTRTFDSYTTDTTIGQGQDIVLVDATAAAVTITLPPAVDRFKQYTIKKTDATGNAVTVDGNAAETIDGALTATLATQYDSIRIASNGAAWWIL